MSNASGRSGKDLLSLDKRRKIFWAVVMFVLMNLFMRFGPRPPLRMGPNDPSVAIASVESWNHGSLEALDSARIPYNSEPEYGETKVEVRPKDVDSALNLLVSDCQKNRYWLRVETGGSKGLTYNKPDISRMSEGDWHEAYRNRVR